MIFYSKYKHYILTVEAEDFRYFCRENPIVKSIVDITTGKELDKLDCSDIPEYKNFSNYLMYDVDFDGYTRLVKQEQIIQRIIIQFEVDKPIFILQNIQSISDEMFRTQQQFFPLFKEYEKAYFHKFLEDKQYELFPNGYCGVVKEYYDFFKFPLKREVFISNGKFEGLERTYKSNGEILIERTYVDGKKHGLETNYDMYKINRKLTSTTYLNNIRYGEDINYYNTEKNNPKIIEMFDNGILKSRQNFYKDGQLKEEIKYDINGRKIRD